LEDVSVRDLIERGARGFDVSLNIEDADVRADPRRIVQVLRNLLVNASTYGTNTEVRAIRNGDFVEIRVSDDGPGVPPEHRARIFDRFHRADASRSRTTGGAGLGLAIAKELVEMHGGRIWLEGASTFVFTLRSVA
jgi:signal transduction histidine kinase